MLTYEKITLKNIKDFSRLQITAEQKKLLPVSHLKTLWHSIRIRYAQLFLIRNDREAVGCILLYPYPKYNKYNVGRLYIDQKWQGKGYGKEALLWGMEKLKEKGAPRILLSVHQDNVVAKKLYESVGFEYTDMCWGQELVMRFVCK